MRRARLDIPKNFEGEKGAPPMKKWKPNPYPWVMKHKPKPSFRTQKARGLDVLRTKGLFHGYGLSNCTVPKIYSIWPHAHNITLPCFARPCPTVPRHGFVESRLIENATELSRIIAETMAQDPQGEVIFMPRLTGRYSGIATHAGIAYGMSNDGATSGTSSKMVPAWSDKITWNNALVSGGWDSEGMLKESGIKDTGYVEFVENDDMITYVQLRDGPVMPRALNYIPAKCEVKRVLRAEGDLLAWETITARYENEPGLCVWHPKGTLSSHYAVHCMIHKIPVIIDHCPKIGDILEPTKWQAPDLTPSDLNKLAALIGKRLASGYNRDELCKIQRGVCHNAVGVLHAQHQWDNSPHLMRLRAEGVAGILDFTAAACIGEDRHFYQVGPGGSNETMEPQKPEHCGGENCETCDQLHREWRHQHEYWRRNYKHETKLVIDAESNCELVQDYKATKPARDSVFARVLTMPSDQIKSHLIGCEQDFGGTWKQGFGGSSWQDAAQKCLVGYERVEAFLREPNKKNWLKVMAQYNAIVNACHNGGKILNKWISASGMDKAAYCPGPIFINPFTAQTVLAA